MRGHPPGEASELPDLAGAGVGRYLVEDRLGWGPGSAVYRAVERPSGRHVALKVLDPERSASRSFVNRFVAETGRVAALHHPGINPVYDVGMHRGLAYVGMRLVRGGSLQDHLRRRRLDLDAASRVLLDVAAAVAGAHEVGVIHGNLKATNVLIDTDGSACVTDFGLGHRTEPQPRRLTPGLAPEQLRGELPDERSDVHALGVLLEAMLSGGPSSQDWMLPATLGPVISSALQDDPAQRPQSVGQLLERLALGSWRVLSQDAADTQLRRLLDASFDPAFAVDRRGLILHWNERAEQALRWPAGRVVGRPLLATLIAPRHRELAEHLVLMADSAGPALPDGHTVELRALAGDGTEHLLEVSISALRFGRGAGGAVLFCRDVTESRAPVGTGSAAPGAPGGGGASPLEEDLARECRKVGLGAAAVWALTADRLGARCEAFWHAPGADTSELEMLTQGVQRLSHLGAVGAVVRGERDTWRQLDGVADGRRPRAARRAGFRGTEAVPILDAGGAPTGALEVFGDGTVGPAHGLLAEMAASLAPGITRRPPAEARRQRFVLDPATSTVGFSCAFMKLLTVHGAFRDVSGWMDIEGDDPATIRGGAVIKAASVETGSLDRDYHLCSADFFNVERFPDLVFKVTRVAPMGDQCFRVLGELTIRSVTRPIRLDARLEDADSDQDEVRRITLTAGSVIKRLDWFLDWERALQAGRWIVGDWVRLDLVLTLVREHGDEAAEL